MTKPAEWSIRCPWCQAAPGNRCTSPRGRRLAVDSHDARIQAHTARTRQQTGGTK
ncbi:hypothetical protein [Streptomyces caniscabiei]|uniref:zinc finger domain-containing protein n=1 Tax=Streptomyces caniscabiei TaxID=2746961 RepID=UPI003AF5C01B